MDREKLKQKLKKHPKIYAAVRNIKNVLTRKKANVKYRSAASLKKAIESLDLVKLHLGCGTVYKDGWINTDNNSDGNIEKLDFSYDLSRGIPLPDNSVDYIYNEHLIEHLTREDGAVFLTECLRTLRTGGVLRLSTPDLDAAIREYQDPALFNEYKPIRDKYGYGDFSPCQTFNINLRAWGHQFLYNKSEMNALLSDIGIGNDKIAFCNTNESNDPNLRNLETRFDTGFIIVEVIK
jgi:predicted SAM-dependent methyltransferase